MSFDPIGLSLSKGYTEATVEGMGAIKGDKGEPGPGVAPGGTTGQVLAKASSTDYDTQWVDQTGGENITAGDGLTRQEDTLSVTTPVNGIVTQSEFDALPEAQQNKGLYVIPEPGDEGNASNVYSTDETRVGTWIDGKPIYRRVFTCKIPTGLTVQNTYFAYKYYGFSVMDTVTSLRAFMETQQGAISVSYIISGTNMANIYFSRQLNQFGIIIGKEQIGQQIKYIHITMEYTRTDDVATVTPPVVLNTVYTGKQNVDFVTTT